jgi:hypothetical protein
MVQLLIQSVLLFGMFLNTTGYKMIHEQVNAIRIMQILHTRFILHDFSDQCEDLRLDDGPIFFYLTLLLFDFLRCKVSQKHNYCVIAEQTECGLCIHIINKNSSI